jgi:hypothetical protein
VRIHPLRKFPKDPDTKREAETAGGGRLKDGGLLELLLIGMLNQGTVDATLLPLLGLTESVRLLVEALVYALGGKRLGVCDL